MLHAATSHFTKFFTPNSVLSAKPVSVFRLPHVYSRVSSTAIGRRDSASPQISVQHPSAADMNAQAMPFRPGGGSNEPHFQFQNQHQNNSRNEHIPPPMPPFGHPNAPWNMGFPPHQMPGPPPPPPFFAPNHFPMNEYEAHQRAQADEQARMHYQWAQNQYQHGHGNGYGPGFAHGHPGPHSQFQPPYNQPQMYPQQHHGNHYPNQRQQHPPPPPHHQSYQHPAHYQAMQQANWSNGGATNEELQYAFTTLLKDLHSKRRTTNAISRAPTPSNKKNKKSKAKAKAKAAANGEDTQEYGTLHRIHETEVFNSRINKSYSVPQPATNGKKKGRRGDEKIMLPAPQPTDLYLTQAAEGPTTTDKPGHILVVLDLNGTVLFRPNKNAKTMIARPYLKPFLQYLFQNFKVMVWSSARPVNVKALVDQALDKDLRSKLVATWARDTFGLSATNFNLNVQVYKNLRLIWSRDQIQQHHPEYASGQRFGQHNTVLIDDSALKASAQPHNLLEIPEFEATSEQMEGDVLREVAGYLEVLRGQADVSKFVHKEPFTSDCRWNYDWPAESAGGGEMKEKVSMKGKRPTPSPKPKVSDMTASLSSVSLSKEEQNA